MYSGDKRALFDFLAEPGDTEQGDDGDGIGYNCEEVGVERAEAELSERQGEIVGNWSGRNEDNKAECIDLFAVLAVDGLERLWYLTGHKS
mgnify:FL=1